MKNITLSELLNAYAIGIFPMSEDRHDPSLFWVSPEFRGILPLDQFHIPKRLRRTVKSDKYQVRIDTCFQQCVIKCAESGKGRQSTWINDQIIQLYQELFEHGHAHSVECWRDDVFCGGLYGVALGGAFFGESMFSTETDASKVALVHLIARLKAGGYTLLDTQFISEHLQQFGAIEVPRVKFKSILDKAILVNTDFHSLPTGSTGSDILQSITQIS